LGAALSAGSYAAIKLPANSVGSKQIKAKAVTNAKLGNRAVTAPKIPANAVDGSKVTDGSLTGADINLTTLGKVPSAGVADAAAIARVKQVTAQASTSGDVVATASAVCDAGLVVIGGGARMNDESMGFVNDAYPDGATAFTAHANGAVGNGFTVFAICAPAASTR
jgi:hypothetical protein